uniref:EF-hand calcium binding domain 10 n=1 Tax=Bos taurus TaxID=9913 RepID=A0A3Q1LQN3_BOVIN
MEARSSRELQARNYLEKHRIMDLLTYLTSALLFFRPGLMLKLKLQYFGHLMRRTDSLEKTLMLGKTEGGRRGQQRMRWLDERPREYLISILERLRIARLSGVALPFFMDNSNIASMFEMLDSSNKGSISFVQYKEALKTLGLCTAEEVLKDDGHGVTFDKFRNEVNKRTQEIWSAF